MPIHGYFHWWLLDNYRVAGRLRPEVRPVRGRSRHDGTDAARLRRDVPQPGCVCSSASATHLSRLYAVHKRRCTLFPDHRTAKGGCGCCSQTFTFTPRWSDGKLSMPEVVDLFGRTGHDVIAITDHIVNTDNVDRQGHASLRAHGHGAEFRRLPRGDRARAAARVGSSTGCGVAGRGADAERDPRKNSAHVLALGVERVHLRGRTVEEMLGARGSSGVIVVACHPNEQSDWFSNTFYLWNRRNEVADLIDLWEVACRWDLFPPGLARAVPVHRQQRLSPARSISTRGRRSCPAAKTSRGDLRTLARGRDSRSRGWRRMLAAVGAMSMIVSLSSVAWPCRGTIVTIDAGLLDPALPENARPFGGLSSRQAVSFLSILKPVCGLDDELEANLVSFARTSAVCATK